MKTEEQIKERKEKLIQMYKKLENGNFSKKEVYRRLDIIKAHLDELNYILEE